MRLIKAVWPFMTGRTGEGGGRETVFRKDVQSAILDPV